MIFPILSAILGILAFLPFNFFWIFSFIFLAPLFIFFLKEKSFWRLLSAAFIFKIIFLFGTVYYTFEPFTWLSTVLIFLGLPIFIFLLKRFAEFSILNSYRLTLISLPFLFTIFDHLEARWTLYPTYIITAGNSFGSSPFRGLAALGGLTMLTFFVVLINVLIAFVVVEYRTKIDNLIINNEKTFFKKPKNAVILIIAAIIFIGWQISQFELRKNAENYASLNNYLKIAVVSVNEKFKERDLEYVKNELKKESGIDLLILPEDVLNNSFISEEYNSVDNAPAKSFFSMRDLAKEMNVNLITVFDTEQPRRISSVLFDKNGEITDISHKIRLTFIGERWPFGNWRPFFLNRERNVNSKFKNYVVFNSQNYYSRGEKKLLISRQFASAPFTSLICLEIHYPEDLKKYKKMGAKFIVNPTSNRWLGAGLEHFLYLTNNLKKIESVWLKIPVISSGVKDFAGIIMPDGNDNLLPYETKDKNYNLFIAKIRYN